MSNDLTKEDLEVAVEELVEALGLLIDNHPDSAKGRKAQEIYRKYKKD